MKTDIFWEKLGLSVEFDYTAPCRGSRDRYGVQMEPDLGAEIDLCSVTIQDQSGVDHELLHGNFLHPKMLEWIEEQCWENVKDLAEIWLSDRND